MKDNKNKKKWIRARHVAVRNVANAVLTPYCRLKYGFTVEKFKEQENRPYLILMNHQTPFDQFFVGMAFKGAVYYLASEDIFSNGLTSWLIKYLVAPIPIKKQTTDVKAIINCIRIAKEGGTIALAPEGNRTYSGRTEYMSPSIAPLARKLGLPVALFRIEGGYGVQPRWSDVVRKGKMRGYVSKVIYPEEYASLTDDELFELIEKGLYVDEAVADGEFRHKRCAEYLERTIYVCPECKLSTFESDKDIIKCKNCGLAARYLPTKELVGINTELPFRFVADWYDYQKDIISGLDLLQYTNAPLYQENAQLYEVIPSKRKLLVSSNANLSLFGDRMTVEGDGIDLNCDFDNTAAFTVLGRNKLNVYVGDKVYQIKGDKRFNALKYVHIYHRYKNIKKGVKDGQFLGL